MAPALAPASSSARSSHTRQYVVPSGVPPPTHTILFYAYRHVADPDAQADEHVELCASLQVRLRGCCSARALCMLTLTLLCCAHVAPRS